ncbi:Ig-like domain-containing protein [Klebsiella oxytoca]
MVAGEDGRWTFTPDTLNEGDHSLSTTVTDKAGNVRIVKLQ